MDKIELRRLVDGKYSVIGLDGREKYILQPMGRSQAYDVERALNAVITDYAETEQRRSGSSGTASQAPQDKV